MMPVLVTSNKNKEREFKLFLDIEVASMEYPELKSDDPCEISKTAAKMLAEKLKRPVIVEDSGLFIDALNGFPGTSSKYVTARIGNEGLLKVMNGVKNRKCFYKSAVGYCEPGKEPICMMGIEEGSVAGKEKGRNGWGNDPIFIPKGKSKTYGEIKENGEPGKFRVEAIRRLKDFLSAGNN